MKTLTEIQRILDDHRETLTSRFGVRRIAVFGAYARQEHTSVSDVDIAAELARLLGWEIVDLHDYLEEILNIRVDLATIESLRRKPHVWTSVERDLVYAGTGCPSCSTCLSPSSKENATSIASTKRHLSPMTWCSML